MSDNRTLVEGPPTLADLWEILRLPALLALGAVAASWLVWYFTSESCTMELAQAIGCNPSRLAQYINLDALNKIAAHGVVAGSGGGLWSYAMITRERRAREDLAKQLAEERQRSDAQLAEERRRSDERLAEERQRFDAQLAEERRLAAERQAEERQRSEEERQQFEERLAEERRQAAARQAEERQRSEEERRRGEERLAEERRQGDERLQVIMQHLTEERAQSAEERKQLMSRIEHLTHRNGDQQNGDGGATSQ